MHLFIENDESIPETFEYYLYIMLYIKRNHEEVSIISMI